MGKLKEGQEPLVGRRNTGFCDWIRVSVQQEDIQKGKKKSQTSCPIALALRRHCSPSMDVHVEKKIIAIQSKGKIGEMVNTYFWAKPTAKAKKFMDLFDAGKPVRPITLMLICK